MEWRRGEEKSEVYGFQKNLGNSAENAGFLMFCFSVLYENHPQTDQYHRENHPL